MGSICGIIFKNQQASEDLIRRMLNSMSAWRPDHSAFVLKENAAFGTNVLYSMSYSRFATLPWEDDRYLFAYDGRFDIPETLKSNKYSGRAGEVAHPDVFQRIREEASVFDSITDDQSFKHFMINFLRENIEKENHGFKGDFAIAAWDKIHQKFIGIRDHFGVRPFYYCHNGEYFAFATEIKALLVLPGMRGTPDQQWIADTISTVKSEKFRTPYINIYRLLPGHRLTLEGDKIEIEKYWKLSVNPSMEDLSEEEAIRLFREKLVRAISRRTRHAISVGSELSGGLDSSGVTALAKMLLEEERKDIAAFSHGFSEKNRGKFFPFRDELEFSRALAEHSGITRHFICPAENHGIVNAIQKSLEVQSGPIQQAYSIFSDNLYAEAEKQDIRVLLSGFGGDEAVSSRSSGYIGELRNRGNWKILRQELSKNNAMKSFGALRSFLTYYRMRLIPLRYSQINKIIPGKNWKTRRWKNFPIDPSFEKQMNIRKRYFEMVGFPDDPDVRMRQHKRILHNHVSQRFEYSYLAGLYHRMEYAYPLWDVDLVEFYYSLPSRLKVKNGVTRYIYREAMKGILPEKIRSRKDKTGATIPTVFQRIQYDSDAIARLIKEAETENPAPYLNYKKMYAWLGKLMIKNKKSSLQVNPGVFFNCLQLLLWRPNDV